MVYKNCFGCNKISNIPSKQELCLECKIKILEINNTQTSNLNGYFK